MFNLSRKRREDDLPVAKILPFRKRKSVIALDFEGDTVHAAQASGQGRAARVTRLGSAVMELPKEKREDAAAFGTALRKALASLKINPKEVALSLPRAQTVLRPLQVPMAMDVRELASVINFQISKDLPFRLEDAAIDFKVLRQIEISASETPEKTDGVPEKRLEVLVGAVRSDLVTFYQSVAKAAGFKLAALGLRSVAAAYCALHCSSVPPGIVLLLVSVRTDETTIDIVLDEKLVFSRAAAIAASPTEGAAFLQALEIEVVRSLHSYEGTAPLRPLERVLVAGGTGLETQVRDFLQERLKLPTEVLDTGSCLALGRRDEDADAPRAVAAIGLALSALENGGLALDFANPKKPAVHRNANRTRLLAGAVAAMFLFLLLFGIRMNLIKKRLAMKQEVQAQLTDAEKKLPIYRRLKGQNKVINAWLADDQNWLDHIAYLSAVLPAADEIFVSTFTTSPQHLIRFAVQAKSGELLAELDKKLRAAGYEVRPLSITPANDKNGYNFRTTVELSIPRKLKPDLSKAKPPERPMDDASLKRARKSS